MRQSFFDGWDVRRPSVSSVGEVPALPDSLIGEMHLMRTQTGLKNRLDSYAKAVRENRATGKAPRRDWWMYAAAAGSGLAMTTSAEASIVYSTPLNLTAKPGYSWHTAINGAKFTGFATFNGSPGPPHGWAGQATLLGKALETAGGNNVLKNFASGAKILQHATGFFNSGNVVKQRATYNSGTVHSLGHFNEGEPGFAGIKIGSDFGWMELKWSQGSAPGNAIPGSLTLLGWAYETDPNTAIAAGDTGVASVPEPSTGLMGLLAAGAGGVLAWRKRRKSLPAATA
jgi:hypothetical protein